MCREQKYKENPNKILTKNKTEFLELESITTKVKNLLDKRIGDWKVDVNGLSMEVQ